jgi:predicted alpha/beta-hydrolase family hydrolase
MLQPDDPNKKDGDVNALCVDNMIKVAKKFAEGQQDDSNLYEAIGQELKTCGYTVARRVVKKRPAAATKSMKKKPATAVKSLAKPKVEVKVQAKDESEEIENEGGESEDGESDIAEGDDEQPKRQRIDMLVIEGFFLPHWNRGNPCTDSHLCLLFCSVLLDCLCCFDL